MLAVPMNYLETLADDYEIISIKDNILLFWQIAKKEKEIFLSISQKDSSLHFFLSKQTDLMGEYTQTFNLPLLQLSFEFLSIINI